MKKNLVCRISPPSRSILLLLFLLATASHIRAEEKIDHAVWSAVRGNAMINKITSSQALYQAQTEALNHGLALVLQEWLSSEQFKQHDKLLAKTFFNEPQLLVLETKNAVETTQGNEVTWTAEVQFNMSLIVEKLRQNGLLSMWDQQPTLVINITPQQRKAINSTTQKQLLTWLNEFSPYGIVWRWSDEKKPSRTDGTWEMALATTTTTNPLSQMPQEITTVTLQGTVQGVPLTMHTILSPQDYRVPSPWHILSLAEQIITAWGKYYLKARAAGLWVTSELTFATFAAWQAFDRNLKSEYLIFQDAHPILLKRSGQKLIVQYAFFLPKNDTASAQDWFSTRQNWPTTVKKDKHQLVIVQP